MKHKWHCAHCNQEITVYKKGKGHRLFVCPIHGILAVNPFSVDRSLAGAGTGAAIGSVVPGLGTLAGAGIGGAIGGLSGFLDSDSEPSNTKTVTHPHARHMTAFERAYMLESLEHTKRRSRRVNHVY